MRTRQVMVVMGVLLAGSVVMNLRQLWRGREAGVEVEKSEVKVEVEKSEVKVEVEKSEVKVAVPEIDFSGTGLADGIWQLEGNEKAERSGEELGPLPGGEMEVPELVPGGREE